MKILIIGGVAGGATAAARLRRLNENDEIVIFEKDEHIAFANCGLPYYVGETIKNREDLLVSTPQDMKRKYNIDVRIKNEVISIIKEDNKIEVLNHLTNETYFESYDKLIISTGANPITPPFKSLNETTNFLSLRNVSDVDKIYDYTNISTVKNIVVIGGGFIGIEMVENLIERGFNVTLIERNKQILKNFDPEMVSFLELQLKNNNVDVLLGETVVDVTNNTVYLESGKEITTDLTINAIGVRPSTKLAKKADLVLGAADAIIVDENFKTSNENIYAIGDAIMVKNHILNKKVLLPLAWPANRQARVLADILNNKKTSELKFVGTSILKVFDLSAASTGLNEFVLKENNINFDSVIITKNSHASYYPNSSPVTIKLLFNKQTQQIYGAQAIGRKGVSKRIDLLSMAIKNNLKVEDLTDIEVSYAPPFNSAKDPVNILGYAAQNIIEDNIKVTSFDNIENYDIVIDVRTKDEFDVGHISGAINFDLNYLRDNLDKLNKNDNILLYCQVGQRGYIAQRMLLNSGFTNVTNLSGGYLVYKNFTDNNDFKQVQTKNFNANEEFRLLDCVNLSCPGPIMKIQQELETMKENELLKVMSSDSGFAQDIESFCNVKNLKLKGLSKNKNIYEVMIRNTKNNNENTINIKEDKGTIVLFSGELDKALASLVIANGAASMGKQMTIFATFWGINLLRKTEKTNTNKTLTEKMFGFMMPKGPKKLKLSNMDMGGAGRNMIKKTMNKNNVDQLEVMLQTAIDNGVNIVCCTMSMELMGIKEEEIIDGVSFAGVAKYIEDSTNADMTLFI